MFFTMTNGMFEYNLTDYLLVKNLGGLVKSVDESIVDQSCLQDFLESCVHVKGSTTQNWRGGSFTKNITKTP